MYDIPLYIHDGSLCEHMERSPVYMCRKVCAQTCDGVSVDMYVMGPCVHVVPGSMHNRIHVYVYNKEHVYTRRMWSICTYVWWGSCIYVFNRTFICTCSGILIYIHIDSPCVPVDGIPLYTCNRDSVYTCVWRGPHAHACVMGSLIYICMMESPCIYL